MSEGSLVVHLKKAKETKGTWMYTNEDENSEFVCGFFSRLFFLTHSLQATLLPFTFESRE